MDVGGGSLWHSTELRNKGYLVIDWGKPMGEASELHQTGPMSYISAFLRAR